MSQVVAVYGLGDVWKQSFVWGDRVDAVIALEQADVLDYDGDSNAVERTRSFYHLNALGSVMEITDANQALVSSYRYTPYGEVTITRGGVTQGTDPLGQYWGYTGRFSDEETGLWYYRARFYDPSHGRFVSRDPAGYAPGPNLYAYADSSPMTYCDPSGLQAQKSKYFKFTIYGVGVEILPSEAKKVFQINANFDREMKRLQRKCDCGWIDVKFYLSATADGGGWIFGAIIRRIGATYFVRSEGEKMAEKWAPGYLVRNATFGVRRTGLFGGGNVAVRYDMPCEQNNEHCEKDKRIFGPITVKLKAGGRNLTLKIKIRLKWDLEQYKQVVCLPRS